MAAGRNRIGPIALSVLGLLIISGALCASAPSDAAADVTTPVIQVFTENSEGYSSLAYAEDQLPLSVNASRYVRHGEYWYNIDAGSGANGSYLTYGDFGSEMSSAEMKSSLTIKYGLGFTIVQVSMLVNNPCGIQYTIAKDEASLTRGETVGPVVEGYDVQYMKFVDIVQVGSSGFAPAESLGTYTLSVSGNGIPMTPVTAVNGVQTVNVTGTVRDASDRPIANAIVYYAKSDNVESHATTDSTGTYRITVSKGDLVKVNSVALSHYTFNIDPVTTGNLTADAVLPVLRSQERTVLVHVTDSSGTVPLEGVRVIGEWFIENHDAVSGEYSISKSTDGITNATTDSDGNASIICRDPQSTKYALLVYAQTQTNGFDFVLDGDLPSPSAVPYDFARRGETGSELTESGNDFADLADFNAVVELNAVQSCITLTVRGQTSGLEGGAPIPKISVGAEWRYQVYSGGAYTYPNYPGSEFVNVVQGTVFAVSKSDAEGHITIAYSVPTWDAAPGLSAFLYIYQKDTSPVFSFNVPELPSGGTNSLEDMVAGYGGVALLPSTAVADCEIVAEEVAYTVSGTITGTIPPGLDNIVVAYSLFRNVDSIYSDKAVVDQSTNPATFSYTVKAGLFSKIELAVINGYQFTTASHP